MVTADHRWSHLPIIDCPCAECDHRAFPRPDQARDQGRQVLGAEKVTTLTSHVSRVNQFKDHVCRKNNLAAKKSRDTRRMRENQLRLRVLFLENANKVLREQMEGKDQESGKLRWFFYLFFAILYLPCLHSRERLRQYESTEANCHGHNH